MTVCCCSGICTSAGWFHWPGLAYAPHLVPSWGSGGLYGLTSSYVWQCSCWRLAGFGWGDREIGPCLSHHVATQMYSHSSSFVGKRYCLGEINDLKCKVFWGQALNWLHIISTSLLWPKWSQRTTWILEEGMCFLVLNIQSCKSLLVIHNRPVDRSEVQNDDILLVSCFKIFYHLLLKFGFFLSLDLIIFWSKEKA